MNIQEVGVKAFQIENIPALDPVTVILRETGPSQGRLIVECSGKVWCRWWGSMGTDLVSFILNTDGDYLTSALSSGIKMSIADLKYLRRVVQAVQDGLRLHGNASTTK